MPEMKGTIIKDVVPHEDIACNEKETIIKML